MRYCIFYNLQLTTNKSISIFISIRIENKSRLRVADKKNVLLLLLSHFRHFIWFAFEIVLVPRLAGAILTGKDWKNNVKIANHIISFEKNWNEKPMTIFPSVELLNREASVYFLYRVLQTVTFKFLSWKKSSLIVR